MAFFEHGEYCVQQDGEILVFVAQGEWNLEASEECIRLISSAIPGPKFAAVVDTKAVTGITHDSIKRGCQPFRNGIIMD